MARSPSPRSSVAQPADPLPSWNDGPAKQAIVNFVAASPRGRPNLSRPPSGLPSSTTTARCGASSRCTSSWLFALDRVKALAPKHPEWKDPAAVQGRPRGRHEGVAAAGERACSRSWRRPTAGMTTEEFDADREGLARHGAAPALQAALHRAASTSRCSSCWPTCAPTASRRSSSRAAASSSCGPGRSRSTASRPSRSSARRRQAEVRDAGRQAGTHPKLPEIDFVDDGPGKPVGIHRFIGRRPIVRLRQLRRRPPDAAVDDRRRGPAFGSSSTTPTPSANRPTTAIHSAGSTRRWTRRRQRLDRRRHEAGTGRRSFALTNRRRLKARY